MARETFRGTPVSAGYIQCEATA